MNLLQFSFFSEVTASAYIFFCFICGKKLTRLEKDCGKFLDTVPIDTLVYKAMRQAIINLNSIRNRQCIVLSGDIFKPDSCFDKNQKPYDAVRACILCCMYSYLFNDYTSALKFLKHYRQNISYIVGHSIFMSLAIFYDALVSLSVAKLVEHQEQLVEETKSNISKLRGLCETAPMNYENKICFLEAELAVVVNGNTNQAIVHYQEAVDLSKKNKFVNEEGMANERAGMMLLSIGLSSAASDFLLKSYQCYHEWGAVAKMRNLKHRYPDIFKGGKYLRLNVAGIQFENECQESVSMISEVSSVTSNTASQTTKRKRCSE